MDCCLSELTPPSSVSRAWPFIGVLHKTRVWPRLDPAADETTFGFFDSGTFSSRRLQKSRVHPFEIRIASEVETVSSSRVVAPIRLAAPKQDWRRIVVVAKIDVRSTTNRLPSSYLDSFFIL